MSWWINQWHFSWIFKLYIFFNRSSKTCKMINMQQMIIRPRYQHWWYCRNILPIGPFVACFQIKNRQFSWLQGKIMGCIFGKITSNKYVKTFWNLKWWHYMSISKIHGNHCTTMVYVGSGGWSAFIEVFLTKYTHRVQYMTPLNG